MMFCVFLLQLVSVAQNKL